jgi:hypothetical protein
MIAASMIAIFLYYITNFLAACIEQGTVPDNLDWATCWYENQRDRMNYYYWSVPSFFAFSFMLLMAFVPFFNRLYDREAKLQTMEESDAKKIEKINHDDDCTILMAFSVGYFTIYASAFVAAVVFNAVEQQDMLYQQRFMILGILESCIIYVFLCPFFSLAFGSNFKKDNMNLLNKKIN